MQPSSIFCRTQQARQEALAASATLANVRGIADMAAAAWGKEAAAADKREQRMERRRALGVGTETGLERALSENPDRGYATAA